MNIMPSRATTRIINLRLSTIIGCNDWERIKKQDIIINVIMEFDPRRALSSDDLADTLDYRSIKKQIISLVASSSFNLLETLTASILNSIMDTSRVLAATVTVDKPNALRYADSVAISMHAERTS